MGGRKAAGEARPAKIEYHLQQLGSAPSTRSPVSKCQRPRRWGGKGCKYIRKKSQSRIDFGSIVGTPPAEP